jgi:hypothetical protein
VADNSLREQIIKYIEERLNTLSSIKTVQRVQPTEEELQNFASTQFPVIAIIGGIPQPVAHRSSRSSGGHDQFKSELKLKMFIYFMDATTPDTTISYLLDDIWKLLYADQTLGGLVSELSLEPDKPVAVWRPYAAFSMECILTYYHTTEGI